MTESIELHLQVVRLEERVGNIQTAVSDIQLDQKNQNGKLDILIAAHNRSKGERAFGSIVFRTLVSGGVIGWIWQYFHK